MKIQQIRTMLRNPKVRNVLLVLLFLPVLFIDNRSSHDWGDDFAQYIHQAKNIVQGIPQSETGFIYSQENYIGPTAYPSGFPILLAPVYAIFGNSMKAFTTYISLFYFLLAFLVLFFYRRHFSETGAIVLSILFIYNPQLLLFKQEVMSDLPFTAFLILAFLLYQQIKFQDFKSLVLFSLLLGFIMMIRSVGFVLLAAVFTDQVLCVLRNRKKRSTNPAEKSTLLRKLLPPTTLAVITLVFYFLLNSLIFRIPSGGSLRDYLVFYYSGSFLSTIPGNLEHYVEVFRFIYTPQSGGLHFIALMAGSMFLAMTLFGFVRKVSGRIEMTDLFIIFYFFILLVFPNNYSAFRLLIPTGVLLLQYAALGFKSLDIPYVSSGHNRVLALGTIMVLLFLPGLLSIAASRNTVLEGPQDKETTQAFTYIAKNVPDSATIVFFKPRALALYTGKQGFADPFSADPTSIHVQLVNVNADYILLHNQLTSESMKRYARIMKNRTTEIWKNKKFRLLRIDPFNPSAQY